MKPLVSDQLRTGMATAAGQAMKVAQYAVMAALPMGNVLAQPTPVTACDILTAHPDDANRVAEPVPFNERDAARAVPACEEAVRQHRNQPRLRYQLGLAYDSARRHTESFSNYQQAANADYTAAGFALGWAYANGEGTPRDDAAAIRWYQWAAERGHSAAQNTLGFMYENGRGVTASLSQAADWYRRAHEAGRPIGSANYGRMLALGHGGPAGTTPALRRTLAVTVLRQAVQQDRADAALQLAVMAERGEVAIDRSELIHLWALAEARSTERERARRSLQRLGAQGATAEIEQARTAVAQRQTVLDNERSAAREAREAALRRLAAAAAQPAPNQPSVGAAPSPVAVVPSPASGTASTPPSHGARPVSSSATPTAGLELLMGDRFAWAGIALGVALGVGGVGFWLGRRRGQQALKAAQALQRQTAVSAPSIAAAYLAANQAPGASVSAEKTKQAVDAPTPPQPLSTGSAAMDVSSPALSPADAFRLGARRAQAVVETPPSRSAAMEVTGASAQAKRGETIDPAGMAEPSSAGAEGTREPQPAKVVPFAQDVPSVAAISTSGSSSGGGGAAGGAVNSVKVTNPNSADHSGAKTSADGAGVQPRGTSSWASVSEEERRAREAAWNNFVKRRDASKTEATNSISVTPFGCRNKHQGRRRAFSVAIGVIGVALLIALWQTSGGVFRNNTAPLQEVYAVSNTNNSETYIMFERNPPGCQNVTPACDGFFAFSIFSKDNHTLGFKGAKAQQITGAYICQHYSAEYQVLYFQEYADRNKKHLINDLSETMRRLGLQKSSDGGEMGRAIVRYGCNESTQHRAASRPYIDRSSQSYRMCENYSQIVANAVSFRMQGIPVDIAVKPAQGLSVGSGVVMAGVYQAYRDPNAMLAMVRSGEWAEWCAGQLLFGR